jgi:hypothetical protein
MNEQENIDLNLDDVEDIEILDASETPEYIYVSAEDDQWYADGHSPEDAFIDKFVDTEYFSEEEHLIKKNFIHEVAMKQIEALTHFSAKSVEEDDLKYFSDDFLQNELKKRIDNFENNDHSMDLQDLSAIPQEILSHFSDEPIYVKSKYKTPLSAKLKILKFKMKGNRLYSYRAHKKEGFKRMIQKKFDFKNYFKLKKISWMLFVCKWHDYRLSNQKILKTNFLTKELELGLSVYKNLEKAIIYQDLYPIKENKPLIWFVNLKLIKAIEKKLHDKYVAEVQDYVLDYVKKDLVFSSHESELEYYEPKKKKYKKINKKGKPYRVARIS